MEASPAAVIPRTRVVGGTFGTHRAQAYFCGLPHAKPPLFHSLLAKVEHLERVHRAFVWERPDAEGGGYAYTATIPA